MADRTVQLRERAAADIDDAVSHLIENAGSVVAERFVDALERTINLIGRSPRSGSTRFAYELEIPELRVRPVARFPHLVFYVFDDATVDIWRVLHHRRDIPSTIAEELDLEGRDDEP